MLANVGTLKPWESLRIAWPAHSGPISGRFIARALDVRGQLNRGVALVHVPALNAFGM